MDTISPVSVTAVRVIAPYGLNITFSDGSVRRVDLVSVLERLSGPVFGPLRDQAYFAQASIEGGAVAWPNGVDSAPEALYSDFDALP